MINCTVKLRPTPSQERQLSRWLWTLTGVWNWAVRKIELDAKDRRYYTLWSLKALLKGHSQNDEERDDYIRTFAITDAVEFAKDVQHAMLAEAEDGSTPLSNFLDKMMQAAIDDGSIAVEDEQVIKHGETAPSETWASAAAQQETP